MYGKLYKSMFDGTLAGSWEALITFQQMVILCDADGIIDMTPESLSRRTTIPLEIIKKGIVALETPDPSSRTEGSEGRRINRLDDHRDWGWSIVNHQKYKNHQKSKELKDPDTVRAQGRERQRRYRARNAEQKTIAAPRHTDTDNRPLPSSVNQQAWQEFEQHRKDIRKPLTRLTREKNLDVLVPLTHVEQKDVVDRTIANGWAGLFPPKGNNNGETKRNLSAPERVRAATERRAAEEGH